MILEDLVNKKYSFSVGGLEFSTNATSIENMEFEVKDSGGMVVGKFTAVADGDNDMDYNASDDYPNTVDVLLDTGQAHEISSEINNIVRSIMGDK